MVVVLALGFCIVVLSVISAERVARECELYAEKHRVLPNEVVDCPFD